MKRSLKPLLTLGIAATLAFTACSSGSSGGGSASTLNVYMNMSAGSSQNKEMKTLIEKFEKQSGTKINLTIDSGQFESNMKVKMASGNLPDVWSTHGWSVLRYSKFLEPLQDQDWAKYTDKALDTSMRDSDGKLYALPIEYTVTGIMTNFDVLKKAGIDPDSLKTWDDFNAALPKIKAQGATPIVSSGKDNGPAGDMTNEIAANAFTQEQLDSFKAGTFDAKVYQAGTMDRLAQWAQDGDFNADYVSASLDDMAKALAQGTAAFAMTQPTVLSTALSYNKDANIGFIPFPSNNTTGQYLVGGEGVNAYGVWKDSKNKTKALEFLSFLANPDNATPLVQSIGTYPGLTNVHADLGSLQPSYDKYVKPGELPTKPFFDRVYLPNGMWQTMVSSADSVITKQATPEQAAGQMADQFKTLYGQKG
ncbi:ABC transporter substrate-binding protein [Propionibacterium freudenreichii]|uniref:ABC transporter substrate-binding protein n=1 Tax=Propionibacterium freudenreichii TaxID=1744 RepID=UPI0005A5CB22|nr:ABC transporter substrate-binding protein [Propionibacterium freudenreichii]MDK9593821.1 carbohydrate ABC transporter substrate-binding protein [Propionibacterium freudenreichii]MDK9626175.1 carbohydrate ABC transporter substrate-binding protein [Propionibacterium freudenreichii]MDK9674148.1 carbohydrate ABC transporter substrate-binding protein [Propionibacterium freudenreichii]MDK9676393.1 carbohydrate ABC transporter substrate-binding protein [Propionibacterium freudenreichii]WFF34977.1 